MAAGAALNRQCLDRRASCLLPPAIPTRLLTSSASFEPAGCGLGDPCFSTAALFPYFLDWEQSKRTHLFIAVLHKRVVLRSALQAAVHHGAAEAKQLLQLQTGTRTPSELL